MKLSLQLKLGQQLTMTPQLQQAIRLLQLSTLDLQQEIQEALESNPLLEVDESGEAGEGSDNNTEKKLEEGDQYTANGDAPKTNQDNFSDNRNANDPKNSDDFSSDDNWEDKDIPDDLSVDSSWDDIYTNNTPPPSSGSGDNDDFDFESRNSKSGTLQDHLNWQLNLTPMSDGDRLIAMAIIDAIDPNGQLTLSTESIHAGLIRELDIDEEEVVCMLHLNHQFKLVGRDYRDLR